MVMVMETGAIATAKMRFWKLFDKSHKQSSIGTDNADTLEQS